MLNLKELIMETKDIISLSKIRMEHAKQSLDSAQILLKAKMYKDCANRSYYAIFHAMRAVLAFDGVDMKTHKGIISEFRKLYIKTNIFSKESSDIITNIFDVRIDSDYKDFYIISKKEVEQQLKNAKKFIKEIEKFLTTKYK